MSATSNIESGVQGTRAPRRARRRHAESWIEGEIDFGVRRRRAFTIEIERSGPPLTESEPEQQATVDPLQSHVEPVDLAGRAREAFARIGRAVAAVGRDPMEAAVATATELDRAGSAVGEKAKAVSGEIADVAHAGAERVNHVRRAGLPPVRERHMDKPRITAPVSVRRPRRSLYERIGAHPDRIMLWAVGLGIFLIVIAATSAPS